MSYPRHYRGKKMTRYSKSFGGSRWSNEEEVRKRRVRVGFNEVLYNCWMFDEKYPELDGAKIHRVWASGEGKVVRHLCGCNRCVNPMHLVRGTFEENADDEMEFIAFLVKAYSEKLGLDYSMFQDVKALYMLRPQMVIGFSDKYSEMYEVDEEYREYFRRVKVRELMLRVPHPDEDVAKERLGYLRYRDDLEFERGLA